MTRALWNIKWFINNKRPFPTVIYQIILFWAHITLILWVYLMNFFTLSKECHKYGKNWITFGMATMAQSESARVISMSTKPGQTQDETQEIYAKLCATYDQVNEMIRRYLPSGPRPVTKWLNRQIIKQSLTYKIPSKDTQVIAIHPPAGVTLANATWYLGRWHSFRIAGS